MLFKDIETESDHELHQRWILIPTLIFALLAVVAAFGHGQPARAEAQATARTPAGERF
jgi:hypothetical protein